MITYASPNSASRVSSLVSDIQSLDNESDAIAIQADLREPLPIKEIIASALSTFGPHIDVLINNAAEQITKSVSDMTIDDYQKTYDLNVRATIFMTQAVLPHLRRPGRIINISSVGAREGFSELSLYCSSKAALEGLTRCWAAEFGGDGTTVNAVAPGPVETEMLKTIPIAMVESQKAVTAVQKRTGTLDDICQVVAFLASEESRWISGQTLNASGGFTMY